eukprot:Mrub_02369.p1 GENE.Mrub_02369~~Mrub_02369.p1  ORF type:complete len:572 (-),score=113.78 Mrub_02369:25-1668(-)
MINEKLNKAVANDIGEHLSDHKYWDMLYDTKEYYSKYELMNTKKADPDFTNSDFAKTGWEGNVNIPFDKVMIERKELESAPGFSKFYRNNAGQGNPLNEFTKIQKILEVEYQKQRYDMDYLIKNPQQIRKFLNLLKNEVDSVENKWSALLDDPTDIKKMKVLIYIKEQTKKNFVKLFKHKKNQIDGHINDVNDNTEFNQIIEYFNREYQYEINLLDSLKNKGESSLSEKETLLFNLLKSKYESDSIDQKYLIRLRSKILNNYELNESEMTDLYSLEEQLKTNVASEIEAMQALVTSKQSGNQSLQAYIKEVDEFKELLEYNIDDEQLIEYMFKYKYSDDNEDYLFYFLQMIAHSVNLTFDADTQQINHVLSGNTAKIMESSLQEDQKNVLLYYQQNVANYLENTKEYRQKYYYMYKAYENQQAYEDLYPYDKDLKAFTSKFRNVDEKSFLNYDKFDYRNLNNNKYEYKSHTTALSVSNPIYADDKLYKQTDSKDPNSGKVEFNNDRNDYLQYTRRHYEKYLEEKNTLVSKETLGQFAMASSVLLLML